jgi:glycosyltransferase involved in cell wall biosynthesis
MSKGHRVFVYGARDETFLSGTPFYFSEALQRFGVSTGRFEVVNLGPRRAREAVAQWAAWSARLRCLRPALFLLSQQYHDASLPYLESGPGDVGLVSFLQVLPRSVLRHKAANPGFRLIQYVDVTLSQLLEEFDYARDAPTRVRHELLASEREAYRTSDQVMVFHPGTRQAVIEHYGVDPERVHVLGRGVNLPRSVAVDPSPSGGRAAADPMRMMVVGRGAARKGVFRLIAAIDALEPHERARIELHLAGPSQRELPSRPYIRCMGFVGADQRNLLVERMRSMSLGALLSDADSHPGSVWEFLFLGVPVWVSRLPYIEEELRGFPVVVQPFPLAVEDLTRQLRLFLHEPQRLAALRAAAQRPRGDLSWDRPAQIVGRCVGGLIPREVIEMQSHGHPGKDDNMRVEDSHARA